MKRARTSYGTSLYLEEGDMIIFEETGEVCVLIEKFDVWAHAHKGERARYPTWAWRAVWHPFKDGSMPGPWQKTYEPGNVEDTQKYGISAVNLYNSLSHRKAKREGKLLKVPTINKGRKGT